ncbi:MAG: hypothetical protein H7336_14445 [Bacteriovorax sp.]|nr:hypothetical protein [Bacteriovorax sp.]
MRKLLSLFAIFTIVMSVTFLFSCDSGSFCCVDDHSSASQCSTCTPHMESNYTSGNLHPLFKFIPKIVGQIFFDHINTDIIHIVYSPDRPPALNS